MSAFRPNPTFPDELPDIHTSEPHETPANAALPVPLESSPKPPRKQKEYEYEEEVVYEYIEEPMLDMGYEYEEEVIYEYEYDDSILSDLVHGGALSESEHLPIDGLQNSIDNALAELIPEKGGAQKEGEDAEHANYASDQRSGRAQDASDQGSGRAQDVDGMVIGDGLSDSASSFASDASKKRRRSDLAKPIEMAPGESVARPYTTSNSPTMFHTEPKGGLRLPRPAKTPLPDFVDSITDQKAFREMLEGNKDDQKRLRRHYQKMLASRRPEVQESGLSRSEILALANEQLQKKPKKNRLLNNPAILADVIDELINMKMRATRKGDYPRAKLIGEVIERLRKMFRVNGRIELHKERAGTLGSRLKTVKGEISSINSEWKKKELHLKFELRDELAALDKKHNEQLRELEEAWKLPSAQRKYTKKSAVLLQALTIERKMALTGEYDRAQQMRKSNQKSEKQEAASNYIAMEEAFEAARKQLLENQEIERNDLLKSQVTRKELFMKQKAQELEVLDKRKHAVEGLIAGDGDFNRFVARKFRKSAEIVLPKTVTIAGGQDIPVAGQGHESKIDTKDFHDFRAKTIATPLALPPLKVKRVRRRRRKVALDDDAASPKPRGEF